MSAAVLLEARSLEKTFPLARSIRERVTGRSSRGIHAVDGVDLAVRPGETLGLIGESGSGKTTLGWLLCRLHEPTQGAVVFDGSDVSHLSGAALRRWRTRVQVVFQDPVGSLDPRLRVWQIVSEPIRAQAPGRLAASFVGSLRTALGAVVDRPPATSRRGFTPRLGRGTRSLRTSLGAMRGERRRVSRRSLRERVARLLPTVGLPPDCLDQYPHEFSGGGRQRVALARALSVDPKLVILDEPTSALDVSVQSQILNRLVELQRERGIAYLLITHNVAAVRYTADRVAVMYLGRIVEIGDVRAVLEAPVHPYTKALIAAVPVADVRRRRVRYRIGGEVPTLIDLPVGCRFAPRCPFVIDRCRAEYPSLRPLPGKPGHLVSCHRAEEVAGVPPADLLQAAKTTPPGPVSSPTAC